MKFNIQYSTFKNLLTLFSLLFTLFLTGCTPRDNMYKESRVLMDTYCTITVISTSEKKAKEAIEAGFAEIKKLEGLINYFSPESETSAIGRSAGERPVHVSRETLDLMQKTLKISDLTGGAFDPTIAPLVTLWNFSKRLPNPDVPSADEIAKVLRLVDYRKIIIESAASEIYLAEKGMELDLGGISKGYAADRAVEVIKAKGVKAALVAIAGDIRGYGLSTSGQPWKVGIQNPRPDNPDAERPWEDIIATLHLKDSAISTAGDYQRFFIKDGKRYHHIIDPKTGFPSESGLISVSVIAPEGYISDGIDTAVLILGPEKGMKLLDAMGLGGILVTSENKFLLTQHLNGKMKILSNKYHSEAN